MFAHPRGQCHANGLLHRVSRYRIQKPGLGLPFEVRIPHPHRQHRDQPFHGVAALEWLVLVDQPCFPGVPREDVAHCRAEPIGVGAPERGVNVVYEAVHILREGPRPE